MGTAEVENAIDEHPEVIESAVVGYPHEIKGQGIYALLSVIAPKQWYFRGGNKAIGEKIIGPIAKPDHVQIVSVYQKLGLEKSCEGF